MYGTHTTASAAGATLASTGAATGSVVLAVIGAALVGLALVLLLRKNGKNRP